MKYEISNSSENDFIIDDSITKEAINIIEDLLDIKLNVKLNTQRDILNFLNEPEKYIEDKEAIERIKDLKSLIKYKWSL